MSRVKRNCPKSTRREQAQVAAQLHLIVSHPLLGLFGARDNTPSPAETARIEVALQEHGKEYEFHTYDDAGHAFFSVDRPHYTVEAALDGWERVWEFFGRHLTT